MLLAIESSIIYSVRDDHSWHQQVSVRESDFVARIVGEEFLVTLPKTDFDEASLVAEKISSRRMKCSTQQNERVETGS